MTLIDKNVLKDIFTDIMKKTGNFSFEDGSPFMTNYKGEEIFVYVKNITSAYFKKLPDITRVQLPFRQHYERISNSEIPFIILGYDKKNEIFVNWNPLDIKRRLNSKSNVSLYSKHSLQDRVGDDEIMETYNTNGDKQVFFKKDLLPLFFDNFKIIYSSVKKNHLLPAKIEKLQQLTDPVLIAKIESLLNENQVLKAVEACRIYYGSAYDDMGFKDWFLLVNELILKKQI